MGNDDRSHARKHPPSHLAFRPTTGRRRTKWAFRSRGRIGSGIESAGHENDDQRQNRCSSSFGIDDDLSRIELAAFALYFEAAAAVTAPAPKASFAERAHFANELDASNEKADASVESRLDAFTQRVIERCERIRETETAPPLAKVSRS